jgi:hypothetical protein
MEISVTVTQHLFSPFGHNLPRTLASLLSFLLALRSTMSHENEELIDYDDENELITHGGASAAARAGDDGDKEKKNFSGIHSTGFRSVMRTRLCNLLSHSLPGIFF